MSSATILVAGATGTVGREVVHKLVQSGCAVRVLARDPVKAAAILGPGVEIVAGDLRDPASLRAALSGIESASFATSPSPTMDREERATRKVWVSDAGAYVVLKALAFDSRGENKDAYDLFYVLRNYGSSIDDLVAKLRPLLDDLEVQRALTILKRDFSSLDAVGPMRVAMFLTGGRDDELQADVVTFVARLLAKV